MPTVYILYSAKLDRFYVGFTTNLTVRMEFHRNALPHNFTAKADDWLVYFSFECKTKGQALKIEKHIKRMKSRNYIKNLKSYPEMVEKLLRRYEK
jgi:putative endonuclease